MTLPMPAAIVSTRVTRLPSPAVARALQAAGVAFLTAAVSAAALIALVQGVLVTGGGVGMLAAVVGGAAIVPVLLLRLLFRRIRSRSGWPTAIVVALACVVVYVALFVTGSQSTSIVSFRPEAAIGAVALAAGAASTIMLGGWWRVLGIVGGMCLLWLALTPMFVTL